MKMIVTIENIKMLLAVVYLAFLCFFSYQAGCSHGFDQGWDKGFIRGLENPDYQKGAN